MTPRESFLMHLLTGPLLKADAIVVLCGEDAAERASVGLQLFKQGAADRLVLSGGRHEPPAILGAEHVAGHLLGMGLSPAVLTVEHGSQNTHEQAVNVCDLAVTNGWRRLLLVASGYHLPRAFLTFVAAAPDDLHLIPIPASQSPWHQCPPGLDRTRAELFCVEGVKITEYQALGHCASYEAGLDYLKQWEGR